MPLGNQWGVVCSLVPSSMWRVVCQVWFRWRFDCLGYPRSVQHHVIDIIGKSAIFTFIMVFLTARYFTIACTLFHDFHSLLLSWYAALLQLASVPSFTRIYLTPNSRSQNKLNLYHSIIHVSNHPASQSRETKKENKNRVVYVTTPKFQFSPLAFCTFYTTVQ